MSKDTASTEDIVVIVEGDNADTLRPAPLTLKNQLDHLLTETLNLGVLQTRHALALSWQTELAYIIILCREKTGCEKTAETAFATYRTLATQGGHHADVLRQERQKAESNKEKAQEKATKVLQLLNAFQEKRIKSWQHLIDIVETRSTIQDICDPQMVKKYGEYIHSTKITLKNHIDQIQKYLEEFQFHKIDLDKINQ